MRILMVEDDRDLCNIVSYSLQKDGYEVHICNGGDEAFQCLKQYIFDVVLLDRMLPGRSGLQLLRELRATGDSTPVIMVTAVDGVHDRIEGLDAGADDYLIKPYSAEELKARIRTILRRKQGAEARLVRLGDLTLNVDTYTVAANGLDCALTPTEYELMTIFMQHSGQTLSREQLYYRIWGGVSEVEEGNLDNYIYFLRKRLRTVKSRISINAVYGRGFRMEDKGVPQNGAKPAESRSR